MLKAESTVYNNCKFPERFFFAKTANSSLLFVQYQVFSWEAPNHEMMKIQLNYLLLSKEVMSQ
jgi:hypothetical protein